MTGEREVHVAGSGLGVALLLVEEVAAGQREEALQVAAVMCT